MAALFDNSLVALLNCHNLAVPLPCLHSFARLADAQREDTVLGFLGFADGHSWGGRLCQPPMVQLIKFTVIQQL